MERGSILAWIGLLFTITGAILSFNWDSIVHMIINMAFPISPTSRTYAPWQKVIVTNNVYLFNWTNPEKLFEENYVPELVELGPYSFKETFEKVNFTWNANHTVTFMRERRWIYDAENSNGTMEDNVTMLNVVPLSASYIMRHWSAFSVYALSTGMRMLSKVWVTKPVREILFEGYDDSLMKIGNIAPSIIGTSSLPGDKMGWFFGRNGTTHIDGVMNVFTGAGNVSKIGQIHSWNYNTRNKFYDGECGDFGGSLGGFFPSGLTRDKPLYLFNPDICRTVKMYYTEDTEVIGIPAYSFEGSSSLVDNGTTDPSTACGCTGECLPAGVYNYSQCRFGIPAFLSYPHFFRADPFYLRQVKGLKPDPEKHRFHVAVEPTSGIPLHVAGRIQLNMLLQPIRGNSMYRAVPKIMFPMLWFEEKFTATNDDVWELKWLLLLPVLGVYFFPILTVVGLGLLTMAVLPRILHYVRWRKPHLLRGISSEKKVKGIHTIFSKDCILTTVPEKEVVITPEEYSLLNTKHTDRV